MPVFAAILGRFRDQDPSGLLRNRYDFVRFERIADARYSRLWDAVKTIKISYGIVARRHGRFRSLARPLVVLVPPRHDGSIQVTPKST